MLQPTPTTWAGSALGRSRAEPWGVRTASADTAAALEDSNLVVAAATRLFLAGREQGIPTFMVLPHLQPPQVSMLDAALIGWAVRPEPATVESIPLELVGPRRRRCAERGRPRTRQGHKPLRCSEDAAGAR